MTRIIVNADDFGYSDGICQAILELRSAGAITGTSLMCAAVGAADRFRRWNARELRGFAGVHLQLTGGRPMSAPGEVKTLVHADTGLFRNPRVGAIPNQAEVELEWRRQIEAAVEILGGNPTHLDSHHGVHRIPELFDTYVALAAELHVPVRGAGGDIGARIRSLRIPGSVVVIREWTGRSLGAHVLRTMVRTAIAEHPEEDVIEVVAHPGYNDEYLASVSSLSAAREADHAALLQLSTDGWPRDDGHTLAAHASLLAGPPGNSA